jgi:hypothetical protein
VRLCDGRYFPLHRNAKPICEALCPATKTEIFSGSEIAQATSADGSPYQKLANAFVYREKIVPGCTCNGHDEVGIARMKIEDDPTLDPEDLIATKNRLVPFRTWRKEAKYTPIEKDATQGAKAPHGDQEERFDHRASLRALTYQCCSAGRDTGATSGSFIPCSPAPTR